MHSHRVSPHDALTTTYEITNNFETESDAQSLLYEPPAGTGAATGIIFDTDGTKVVTIRSGREPELSYVEGCG